MLCCSQGQQCSLSVASNGDVIAAAPTETLAPAGIKAPAATAAVAAAAAADAKPQAAAAAAFELKGSGWQTLVQQQGTQSIRVLQEDQFNPEVRACPAALLVGAPA